MVLVISNITVISMKVNLANISPKKCLSLEVESGEKGAEMKGMVGKERDAHDASSSPESIHRLIDDRRALFSLKSF